MSYKVENLNKVLKQLSKFGEEASKIVEAETEAAAREIATNASQDVNNITNGLGKIAQSISVIRENQYTYAVNVDTSSAPYAPYVEFGTGVFVEVANEWKDLAWQFYVNGKGMMHPRPYLYPNYVIGREKYLQNLKNELQNLQRKYK